MGKKKVLGAFALLGTLAVLEYRRRKYTESFGWFAYAPLSNQLYNPTPPWVTNPKNIV